MHRSFAILILIAIAIAAYLWGRPTGDRHPAPVVEGLPWQIETLDNGATRVFGLELGHSTFDDARARFGDGMKLGIVAGQGDVGALEAYFDNVAAGVIMGKLILVAALDPATLAQLRERTTQKVYMNDATYRYVLARADLPQVMQAPIATITFIPAADLDEETVLRRFGSPRERVRTNKLIEHFLYPDKGLDIILDSEGREVLQYVAPREFAQLSEPLRQHGMSMD